VAGLRMREFVVIRRLFALNTFVTLVRNATGPPARPINAVNGLNGVPVTKFFYRLDGKNHSLSGSCKLLYKRYLVNGKGRLCPRSSEI